MSGELPIPRYAIGDVVYWPWVDHETQTLPCPDCLGERVWRVTAPAGTDHTVACPRCSGGYYSNDQIPSLKIQRAVPKVRRLTIASIEAKTNPWRGDDPVKYMATETGVGSGSVYDESKLCATEETALTVATLRAADENAKIDATAEAMTARKFAALKLTDAALIQLKDGVYDAWAAFRGLTYAIEGLLPEDSNGDNDTERAVREAVDRYGRDAGRYLRPDRHPIDAMIAATTPEGVAEAREELMKLAGLDLRPEPPPCTCEHATKYLYERDCPRHGSREDVRL